jgi:hypothetical protein
MSYEGLVTLTLLKIYPISRFAEKPREEFARKILRGAADVVRPRRWRAIVVRLRAL